MKKILVLAACVLMALPSAGCAEKTGSSSSGSGSSKDQSSKASSAGAHQVEKNPEGLEHTSDGKFETDTFDCSLYSFSFDSSLWLAIDNPNVDCQLMYKDETTKGSFNMISVTDDQLKDVKVAEYAAAIKEPYASSEDAEFIADEETTLAGEKAYMITVNEPQDGVDTTTTQIMAIKDNHLYMVTYFAVSDSYSEIKEYAETIISTLKFK